MSLRTTTATIADYSSRADEWREAYGGTTIPIMSPVAVRAQLEGAGEHDVYLLNVKALSFTQRASLVAFLAKRFKSTVEEASAQLDAVGLPIIAKDVTVAFDVRYVI